MNLFLLAAGFGERLRPLTQQIPKPLVYFAQVPLLVHAYGWFKQMRSFRKLIINSHYLYDKLEGWILSHQTLFAPTQVILSRETPSILGSAGAFIPVKDHLLEEPFFWVGNADNVFLNEPGNLDFFGEVEKQHQGVTRHITFLVSEKIEHGSSYLWSDSSLNLKEVGRKPTCRGLHPWHFLGVYCLQSEVLKELPSQPKSVSLFAEWFPILQERGYVIKVHPVPVISFETGKCSQFDSEERRFLELTRNSEFYLQQWEIRKNLFCHR